MIGLGGAGSNIVEAFLKDEKTLSLLENDISRVSAMALDIADADIKSLQETHNDIQGLMKRKGIPQERLRVTARSIKFPSAEAMFDFVTEKYKEHLMNEGIEVDEYNAWLPSTMAIPPLAGGAGRRRALAKAIYNLNYYQLGIIKTFINSFKDQALSAITSPIVFIVFGLGGGTGSGTVLDFARHLRASVGSGVPIIALAILPCSGDDPPAKGYSAFNSLNELSLMLNRENNNYVTKKYGSAYQNPFNATLYLPLMPAYNKTGNIMEARDETDSMIIEMLYNLMDFDIADLLSGIGTEVGLSENSNHTMSMLKISYPVDSYVEAFKLYLDMIQQLSQIRVDKIDVLEGINKILEVKYQEVRDLYKQYLMETNSYDEEDFEEKLRSLIYGSPRFEEDFSLYLKGIEEQINNWMDEILEFVSSIRLVSKSGTIEDSITNLILDREDGGAENLEALMSNISKTYPEFRERKAAIFERLQQLIPSSQTFTVKQKKLLEDFMNLAELTENALVILRFYNEIRHLNEALIRRYEILQESEEASRRLQDNKTELTTIYHLLQLMMRTPSEEVKMIDEHLTYLHGMIAKLRSRKEGVANKLTRLEEQKKRKEYDKTQLEDKVGGFSFFGRNKYAKNRLNEVERELIQLNEEISLVEEDVEEMDSLIELYMDLAKKIEVTSDYRKKLNSILELTNNYQGTLSEIIKPKKFYERTTELTNEEQMKIIYKILAEQEQALSREGILTEILDMEHFKDYMKSVIRVLRTPNMLGLKSNFRTDYLWVTVETPKGLWDSDLTQELYTSLAGYVTGDVSKTITVRVIDSRDPWVIRLLIIGGRAQINELVSYDEMELLYSKASDFEKMLSRSFLIEHGKTFEDIKADIENS